MRRVHPDVHRPWPVELGRFVAQERQAAIDLALISGLAILELAIDDRALLRTEAHRCAKQRRDVGMLRMSVRRLDFVEAEIRALLQVEFARRPAMVACLLQSV